MSILQVTLYFHSLTGKDAVYVSMENFELYSEDRFFADGLISLKYSFYNFEIRLPI